MKKTNNLNLNPMWVTGFTDAEGCFSVILTKRPNLKWRIMVSFEINLHLKDLSILYSIRDFFGVGTVYSSPNRSICVYRVSKIDDLINVIIPHFLNYPLLTHKYSDFVLWSKVVNIISVKDHLTTAGFDTILSYYASINRGMSSKVLSEFPDIVGVERVKNTNLDSTTLLNAFWVSGFVAGDGGFSVGLRSGTNSLDIFYFRFHVAQHYRDVELMNKFIQFFECGNVNVRIKDSRCDFYVQDFNKIYNNIIPHFDSYPLQNIKHLDFADFRKAAELYKTDSKNNGEALKLIINNMNSKRVY
uniref:LAGLIDADG homing endonuclease n=1 Tax=Rhizoctonia solani TaxID=456999 RepID=A0A8E8GRG8_9AGAM|nr:LAGLIDADG homing endonuclease [Rhizoctonia solani]